MIEIKLQPGSEAGAWRDPPGAKVSAGNRGHARRAGRRRLHVAGAASGVQDPGPDDAFHRATARPVGRQTGRLQALHRPAWEFMAICKAMLETGIYPDFIVVDGAEGGTGAAPLEFVDHVGTPMRERLLLAHNMPGRSRDSTGSGRCRGQDDDRLRHRSPAGLGADWCQRRPAVSCSHWAASRRRPVIPTGAQPASQRRTPGDNAGWLSATRLRGCINSTEALWPPWENWWARPDWRTRASFGQSTSRSAFCRPR